MKESIIYEIPHIYRDDFRVRAYTFGAGEKALCVVGNVRGNEYQQIFMCSRLIQRLKKLEAAGRIIPGKEIMVIPSVNPSSMNIGKRFWAIDNTDINRMFPGYSLGETTQRIAGGVFEVVNKYRHGVQFTSFYMPGEFQPHVRMMHTGYENLEKAADFGLPYIVVRDPRPYDTTTLNYNWQIWETDAFSVYSNTSSRIDWESAENVVDGVERFMVKNGMLKPEKKNEGAEIEAKTAEEKAEGSGNASGCGAADEPVKSRVFRYDELLNIRTTQSGLYHRLAEHNSKVTEGQPLAEIIDPSNGDTLETLYSPVNGVIFFQHNEPLVYAYTSALKILKDEE